MNRSVEIICDWKLELKQVPSISSSRMSTRWNIDFGATFGFGAAIVAGQVQIEANQANLRRIKAGAGVSARA